ncbi:iron hydrogenase [Mycena floridula]|nr:iron hydrogenase [Mycena floridula]
MGFSGALTLTDLNDFITPSQACIKPVEQVPSKIQQDPSGEASTEIHIDSTGSYYEVTGPSSSTGTKLEQAQISLNDCLACSGCITSAESVLITLQSHTEVMNFLEANASSAEPKVPVISIAPQTLASLAASVSSRISTPVTPRQIFRRTRAFCKEALGFEYVFDTTFARHIALNEHIKEFMERRHRHSQDPGQKHQLPMLASACPGWICYAEKNSRRDATLHLDGEKPATSHGFIGEELDGRPHEIYHVTVMPCYDKKLEASRTDFYNEVYASRDVDCVITSGELERLMNEKGWDLTCPVAGELEPPKLFGQSQSRSSFEDMLPELISHPGTSSGSYLQAIVDRIALESPVQLSLELKQIRHEDYEEIELRGKSDCDSAGEIVFRGAKCYGFRNLQNLVRKVGIQNGVRVGGGAAGRLGERRKSGPLIKRGYDYVEVMACPGGCVNGGGQLKPQNRVDSEGYPIGEDQSTGLATRWANRDWTRKVEDSYWLDELPGVTQQPKSSDLHEAADQLMSSIFGELCPTDEGLGEVDVCQEKDACRKRFFRTQYRAVESEVVGLAVKW